jgi:hypothetical protein
MEAEKPARRRINENRIDNPGDSCNLSLPSDSASKRSAAENPTRKSTSTMPSRTGHHFQPCADAAKPWDKPAAPISAVSNRHQTLGNPVQFRLVVYW